MVSIPFSKFCRVEPSSVPTHELRSCSKQQHVVMSELKSDYRPLISKRGLTLIEIMVVILIIGGLAAVLGRTVFSNLANANVKTTRLLFKEVAKQLEMYNADCGGFPTTDQGLQVMLQDPGKDVCPNWGPKPYLDRIPKDAWNRPLMYESDGNEYVLYSYGSDRKPGGNEAAKDLRSDDPE